MSALAPDLDSLYRGHVADLGRRYERVFAAHGWDGVVIHSGAPAKRTAFDDQFWPLRPTPHWQHWLDLPEPDGALVVRPGVRPTLVRTAGRSYWERPAPPESLAFLDAFDVVNAVADGAARVREEAHGAPSRGAGRIAFLGEDRGRAEAWGFAPEFMNPPALLAALDALRTTKTPYEVACLVEANRRARAGHDALRDAFAAGDASELDLHLLYLQSTRQDDPETPYKNIVALGAHAATLHHVAYGRTPTAREAESLLVDAGAACRGYGADVTRTWVKGRGEAASLFAALIAGVEAMQARLCAAVQPGLAYEALHDESHRQTASILRDVGLSRASADELVAAGVTRAFYPHGLGHSLGLQTHDVGCGLRIPRPENAFLRNTTDIAVGQVFTIEPGFYFIDELLADLRSKPAGQLVDWSLVEALAVLGGVRVEDDVHVAGPDAVRNLTREHLPRGGGRVGG